MTAKPRREFAGETGIETTAESRREMAGESRQEITGQTGREMAGEFHQDIAAESRQETTGQTGREMAGESRQDRPASQPAAAEFPSVSVIIPARNAEANIAAALDSILAQDYPGPLEIIVADGSDTPATAELLRRDYPAVRIVANPRQTTPNGLNAALDAAAGPVVVRCDTHATLPPDYIRRGVKTLLATGAGVVGGRQRPVGRGGWQRAIALTLATPLGAGDARYRLGGPAGPVDNFYLGIYRRDALEAAGRFDPALTRTQDCEFNWRLRRRGEQVWFDPELTVYYHPRGSLPALARQYFDYGRWKPVSLRKHPSEIRARHLAAPLLALGLAGSGLLTMIGALWPGAPGLLLWAAAALPALYALVLLLGALAVGLRRRDAAALLIPAVAATMHLSWGIGFFLPATIGARTPAAESAGVDGAAP